MANILNILAGTLTFIISSILVYGLWNPVLSFLDYFPTELFIICGATWVTMCIFAIAYMPFVMFVSDDKGR